MGFLSIAAAFYGFALWFGFFPGILFTDRMTSLAATPVSIPVMTPATNKTGR